MAEQTKLYYQADENLRYTCHKCKIPLVLGDAVFEYLNNAFPVQLPICPRCGFIYVAEELAMGKVFSVEKVLEDK